MREGLRILERECTDFGGEKLRQSTNLRTLRITDFGMVRGLAARYQGAFGRRLVAKAIGVATSFELVG